LLGGLPITAAMARTNLNYANGAKSNFAGIFQCLFLLLFYLVLMPFIGIVPVAALIAPLVKVAIATSFFPLVYRLIRSSTKRDSAQLAITAIIAIIFGVHFGIIAGIASSFIVNSKIMKDKLLIEEICFKDIPNIDNFDEKFEKEENPPNIRAFKIKGSIYFANLHKILNKMYDALKDGADEIILDLSETNSIDATVVEKISKYTKSLAKQGKRLRVFNANEKTKKLLEMGFNYIIVKW